MRALKATDGPCFPAARNVCRSTSGFVCSTAAERLWREHVPGIGATNTSISTSFQPWALGLILAPGGWGGEVGEGLLPGPVSPTSCPALDLGLDNPPGSGCHPVLCYTARVSLWNPPRHPDSTATSKVGVVLKGSFEDERGAH